MPERRRVMRLERRGVGRRRALGLAAGTGAAAVLAACGGRGKPSAARTSQVADGAPTYGGQINIRVPVDPIDYDPSYNGKTAPSDFAQGQAHNNLLSFKTGPDVPYAQMTLVPKLAESWEVGPDGSSFVFHLRKGATFANLPPVNGREVTSDDVKWTFEYYSRTGAYTKAPASTVGFMFEGMTGLEAPDKYTVVVRFERSFLPFLSYAASDWNPIQPREVYDKQGDLKGLLIGAGPYQLDPAASQKGTQYLWKKNPTYWQSGQPYADSLRWLVLPQDGTAFAAFQARQVDILNTIADPSYTQLQRSNPQARFVPYLQPQGYHLHMSQAHPGPLNDMRVRQAVVLSVDRDEINRTVAGGKAEWALPGAVQGLFTDAEARQLQKQDVQAAKQLLSAAGYGDGVRLVWPIDTETSQDDMTWYQLFQAQEKRAGIDVVLQPMPKADQRVLRRKGAFDFDVVQALGLLDSDADSVMYGVYHSKGSTNWPQVKDPELDKLLEAQRSEADPQKRRDVQRQAVQRIVAMSWAVELIYPPLWDVAQPYVRNYYPHFSVHAPQDKVWITK